MVGGVYFGRLGVAELCFICSFLSSFHCLGTVAGEAVSDNRLVGTLIKAWTYRQMCCSSVFTLGFVLHLKARASRIWDRRPSLAHCCNPDNHSSRSLDCSSEPLVAFVWNSSPAGAPEARNTARLNKGLDLCVHSQNLQG